MSIAAINIALEAPITRSSQKFVFVSLANRANDKGICFPSIRRISLDTALNRKTVIASIKRLIEFGYIFDTGERSGSTRQVIVYGIAGIAKQSPKRNSSTFSANSTVFSTKESQKRDTEPTTEPSLTKEPIQGIDTLSKSSYSYVREGNPFADEWSAA